MNNEPNQNRAVKQDNLCDITKGVAGMVRMTKVIQMSHKGVPDRTPENGGLLSPELNTCPRYRSRITASRRARTIGGRDRAVTE